MRRYLAAFPEQEQALFGKAVALQQIGRPQEAVEYYRKVLARNPRSEEALSNLVALFLERKDVEAVRHWAAMLAELKPESAVATEALAALAFTDGDYLTAVRHCRTLTEVAPERFENWFNLGVAQHKLGNHNKAAQAYQQATALKADSAQAHLNLGVACQELSDLPPRAPATKRRWSGRAPAGRAVESGAGAGTAGRAGTRRETLRGGAGRRAGVVRRGVPAGLSAADARRVPGLARRPSKAVWPSVRTGRKPS